MTSSMPDSKNEKHICSHYECQREAEKGFERCIFHLSAEEKEKHGLWKRCMKKFYSLLDAGEGNFRGFVLKDVDLGGRVFEQALDFSGAEFVGDSVFSLWKERMKTDFKNKVEFIGAKFHDMTDFSKAEFSGEAYFRDAKFSGRAYFRGAEFNGEADFGDAEFKEKPDFTSTEFKSADFENSYFEKGGSFDYAKINEGIFEDASIQYVSFRGVNLTNVKFAGAQMEFAYLADAEWTVPEDRGRAQKVLDFFSIAKPRYRIREEREAEEEFEKWKKERKKTRQKRTQEKEDETQEKENTKLKDSFKKAEGTYRRLKHTLTNEGAYEKAGEFYINEMRMKRRVMRFEDGWNSRFRRLVDWLFSLLAGYGERPSRILFWWGFVILLSGVISG